MAKKPDEEEKKYLPEEDEESGEGSGSQGGQTGAIEFRYRDILSGDLPDDVLPDTEIRRLQVVQIDLHKQRVDEQKQKRKERDDIKNGRVQVKNYDSLGLRVGGGGGGGTFPYNSHPTLNQAVQFSGATDRKVTGVPSDSLLETNQDMQNKLVEEYDLRNRLQQQHKHVPKFNPRPRGPAG